MRDPIIELEKFYTNPAEPEESVRSEVHFDLAGDTDLVSTAEIGVDKIKLSTADVFKNYDPEKAGYTLHLSIQKIRDILPSGAPISPVEMKAKLNVSYGVGYSKTLEGTHTLYLDRTPPSLEIVSPGKGDFIAIGENTDVIIKSFDKYGVESVEVKRNGGDWEILPDPTRYSFIATAEDIQNGVTISARATDPNHNQSPVQSITLYPYDAEAGAPKVEIISPANGSNFHEGELVRFEVLLRNVVDADLFLDIGGVESQVSAVHISRGAKDPERQFVTVKLPSVSENIVVLARLQKANLKAFKFLNVAKDEGIDEVVALQLYPENKALTGSALWVNTQVPADMIDFSADSKVVVKDPVESANTQQAPLGGKFVSRLSAQGDFASVETQLKDRSGHEKKTLHTLAKIPF